MVTIGVATQGGYHTFTASFSTEDQAVSYVQAKWSTHIFSELDEIPATWSRLINALYPTCHHGLSAQMCMDPYGDNHFGTREWEMAQYGTW